MTFQRRLGFQYLLRGRNIENKSLLAGVQPSGFNDRVSLSNLLTSPSPYPLYVGHAGYVISKRGGIMERGDLRRKKGLKERLKLLLEILYE